MLASSVLASLHPTYTDVTLSSRGFRWEDIAVDGAYDSRGLSAVLRKVLAVDSRTNLCIHTEVVQRSETDGISGRIERGFRRSLLWFADQDLRFRPATNDRNTHFKTVIDEMIQVLSWEMQWYFDYWHLCRYLFKGLREVHGLVILLTSNTSLTRSLYHIAGIHSWDQAIKRIFIGSEYAPI
ncbi:hypothetical protein Aduo_001603 [Ancylostoma duodenale]